MFKQTPVMGWNSWNTFGVDINEQLLRETADAMVESGLKDAGYEYVIIDDGWQEGYRDENDRLVPNKTKFPSGIKALADYVHSKGLKLGIYSSSGHLTCMGLPASYEYEFIDAQTFAEWEVDYLKYDFCHRAGATASPLLYRRMGTALANCGRDILFSTCSWGMDETEKWVKTVGAGMWRSTGDICDSWESIRDLTLKQLPLQVYNGQNCFNDMDMLVVGMNAKGNVGFKGCTFEEYRSHFAIWAMLNSPLIIGCDIRNMTEETKQILMNKKVIAVNQDPDARQPFLLPGVHTIFGQNEKQFAWAKLLHNGDYAIGLFNVDDTDAHLSIYSVDLGIDRLSGKKLVYENLLSDGAVPVIGSSVVCLPVKAHDCVMLRAKVVNA